MISFKQFIEAADHKDQVAQARQKVIDAQQAQQRAIQAAAAKKRFSDEMTRIKGQAKTSAAITKTAVGKRTERMMSQ
jgi:hypothetical protein